MRIKTKELYLPVFQFPVIIQKNYKNWAEHTIYVSQDYNFIILLKQTFLLDFISFVCAAKHEMKMLQTKKKQVKNKNVEIN